MYRIHILKVYKIVLCFSIHSWEANNKMFCHLIIAYESYIRGACYSFLSKFWYWKKKEHNFFFPFFNNFIYTRNPYTLYHIYSSVVLFHIITSDIFIVCRTVRFDVLFHRRLTASPMLFQTNNMNYLPTRGGWRMAMSLYCSTIRARCTGHYRENLLKTPRGV